MATSDSDIGTPKPAERRRDRHHRLLPGAHGGLVRRLQQLLNIANPSATPPLVVDGSYGPATRRAVGRYQLAHGVPATGTVDDRTWVIHIDAASATVASYVGV